MDKVLILLTIIRMGELTFSQDQVCGKIVDEFERSYNLGNYDTIFSSFSVEMQQARPLEKTIDFFSDLRSHAGKIRSKNFIEFQNGTYASYKADFEKATLCLNISVDESRKINGLFIKPYPGEKTENKNVVNALTDLSKEQTEIIFNQLKVFPNKTQVSIAFIENGRTQFYGIVKENDTIKYIDNKDKVFEIGSVSKIFTATLLADAVLGKKVKLDDKINPCYHFQFKDNIQLDFKSLANHTSGLERLPSNLDLSKVDANNPYNEYDKDKLNSYLKNELKLSPNTPGKEYHYSNLGAGLLGYTLGIVQKSDYESLLKDKVFKKYKMTNSFTDRNQIKTELVKGLNDKGNEVSNWDFDVLLGAGGILSTVHDLSKFAIAQFDARNKDLTLTRIPTFTVNEEMKIGLGWHILKTGPDREVFWHNGGTGGYSSSIAIDIQYKNGIVILSNVSAFHPDMGNIDKLCFELMKYLEKK